MADYTIITGEGGELAAGIQGYDQARRHAQECANERGESVFLSRSGGVDLDPEDDEDIGEEIKPEGSSREGAASEFRAYDTVTEWMGPIRGSADAAWKDAARHDEGCRSQGGYGSAIVVREDPMAPGRCVDLDGGPVWPPHGRSCGSVRWVKS